MAAQLRVRVEVGTGGSSRSCTGFRGAEIADGTLVSVAKAHSGYASGAGGWMLVGVTGEHRTYRISYALPSNAPNSVSGGTTAATFVWEIGLGQ